ncbi:hypothetical protein QL093DRAFT_2521881 [Fusarium oxysporum]|nr:hypothetical protein QL093DRAFT_2521881 [Fusarium oxysporum]
MNTQVEGHGRHYSPYNTLPPPPPPRPIEPLLPTMPGQRWQEFSHPRPPSFHQRLPRVKELRRCAPIECEHCHERKIRCNEARGLCEPRPAQKRAHDPQMRKLPDRSTTPREKLMGTSLWPVIPTFKRQTPQQ